MRPFFKVLLLLAATVLMSCATQHEIRILHVNDFHGFAAAYKPYGSEEDQGRIREVWHILRSVLKRFGLKNQRCLLPQGT
ncbi:MAG: hypothetical protein CVU70_04155 [Deltaproteobacteria bacterium HGW-Deltaproteobacteria-5]|nr:MAG: hypothetical protein CVU70_04155 [Deltaproteobacteria bacterium HGW-Deltaproteobacteria-5]